VQDCWAWQFQRPALPIADPRRWTGWCRLTGAAAEAVKPRCIGVFLGCSYVATSVMAACIYREDSPMVITSHNRLGLSLSKRIKHRLVEKINGKIWSWTCEALDLISKDYLRSRRAPVPIALPRPVQPRDVRRAHLFLFFSSPPHTYKCIESNLSYK
jgi:hypothetical protein